MLTVAVGCADSSVLPSFPPRQMEPFSLSGSLETSERWWTSFGSPDLNLQVERALEGNYSLGAALQRLQAARAVARSEASILFPFVDGVGTSESTWGTQAGETRIVWGLEASYQVDLWGQIESRIDAERLRASATREDYQAVALTLAAEVVRTWLALVESHAQLALLNTQIATNETGTEAQELRFGLGLIRSPDLLRQRQLVESTREQAVVVKARIELLEHQLAVLQGEWPQTAVYEPGMILPEVPPLPATGLPSELLQRRPDVRRDFLAFQAADRDLAAAITAQYPRLSLTGSTLNAADSPETLFRDWFVSIGSQLVAPILNGGLLRAEVDRTRAVLCQRFSEYGQTVLTAFREVEDSLAAEKYQLQRIERLDAQLQLARQASAQLLEQYLITEADYLDVLSANTAEQRLQREILSARLELRLIRVSLYLALAGGFDTRPQIYELPADVGATPPVPPPIPAVQDSDSTDIATEAAPMGISNELIPETVIDE
jgi:NodT family efflux transporter outer membrane factor (OMF) lipoprotein